MRSKTSERCNTCDPHVVRRPGGRHAVQTRIPPLTADVGIYSQTDVWQHGREPTWDSPDIITVRASRPPEMLPVATAHIHNYSGAVGVFDALVHCDTAPFGIGMARTRLATQVVSLGPNGSKVLRFPFDPALLAPGIFIGAHIHIENPRDANLANNRGAQAVWAMSAGPGPVTDAFPVRNPTTSSLEIQLRITYNNLNAVVEPTTFILAPGAEEPARIQMFVPTAPKPRENVTILAVGKHNELIDGLTYVILTNG